MRSLGVTGTDIIGTGTVVIVLLTAWVVKLTIQIKNSSEPANAVEKLKTRIELRTQKKLYRSLKKKERKYRKWLRREDDRK
jgi:hypothetical protein